MPGGDMIQIHMLTSYPAALLNRDDAGLAKRVPFGGVYRTRVSSQCLKKHWREAPAIQGFGDLADRSTRIYEQRVAEPLRGDKHGATEAESLAIAQYLLDNTLSKKESKAAATDERDDDDDAPKGKAGKGRKADKGSDKGVRTGQVVVLTKAETDFLAEEGARILRVMRDADADPADRKQLETHVKIDPRGFKKVLEALPASIDTAMFGRMVTSDLFARVDSAVSVAHAFTTHEEASETDYFTAVDTLNRDDAGAGLIQDTELTSGVFYLYAVVDMDQLRNNLVGQQKEVAERLARTLVETMAMVSPGAKRGSTAPYSFAEFVLLERGDGQPRTLANAFLKPVNQKGDNALQRSAQELLRFRQSMAEMYDLDPGAAALATAHELGDATAGLEQVSLRRALDATFGTRS